MSSPSVRKLAVFDTWSALAVHIAMDNTVVMEDISKWTGCGPRAVAPGPWGGARTQAKRKGLDPAELRYLVPQLCPHGRHLVEALMGIAAPQGEARTAGSRTVCSQA